jgi:subtilisin family serine protease
VLTLPSIDGAALAADKADAADTWSAIAGRPLSRLSSQSSTAEVGALSAGLEKLWLDGRVEPTLDVSVPQVHAPEAWAAGFDGAGASVAVLDSGIDADHPDIAGALSLAVSFVPDEEVTDVSGHGTHVASTVLGSGTASDGLYKGVARRDTIGVSASHESEVLGGGEVEGVTLEISYDDGGTWHNVRLRPDGDDWAGTVRYPRNAEFVSFRASGRDDAGNQVEQEIIRAFGLR